MVVKLYTIDSSNKIKVGKNEVDYDVYMFTVCFSLKFMQNASQFPYFGLNFNSNSYSLIFPLNWLHT